jgi:hypothetical protein
MIYGSLRGSSEYPKPVMTTNSGELFYQGGHPNPEHAGPSSMDIKRVVALHPIKNAKPQPAQEKPPTKRSSDANANAQIAKRWYFVPVDEKVLPDGHSPWPQCGDGRCVISYCFEDAESHHYLKDVFNKALAIWAPAIRASSLTFAPDAACVGQQWRGRCLCSRDGVSVDTLHIEATDAPGADATCGYSLISSPLRPGLPLHLLRFPKKTGQMRAYLHGT